MDPELKAHLESLTRQVARLNLQLTRLQAPVLTLAQPEGIPKTADDFRRVINALALFQPLQ